MVKKVLKLKKDIFSAALMTEAEFKWIGVDLDNTIAESAWSKDRFGIGKPLAGAVKVLQKLNKLGWKIVVYTVRPSYQYRDIEKYCKYYKIPVREILTGKPMFKFVVDDRNLPFDGDWKKILTMVKEKSKK